MRNSTVLLIVCILGLGGVGTYLYLKNKKRWVASIWVSQYKVNFSGFSGGEEEIWAGFDNNFDITFK